MALQVIELHKQDSGANVRSEDWMDSREYFKYGQSWPTLRRTWTETVCPMACRIEMEFLSYIIFYLL
jgi:hypothetical protein